MSTDGQPLEGRLAQRLEALRGEFEAGQRHLAELEAEVSTLRTTLLRISGAIQVLEEELGSEPVGPSPDDPERRACARRRS